MSSVASGHVYRHNEDRAWMLTGMLIWSIDGHAHDRLIEVPCTAPPAYSTRDHEPARTWASRQVVTLHPPVQVGPRQPPRLWKPPHWTRPSSSITARRHAGAPQSLMIKKQNAHERCATAAGDAHILAYALCGCWPCLTQPCAWRRHNSQTDRTMCQRGGVMSLKQCSVLSAEQ